MTSGHRQVSFTRAAWQACLGTRPIRSKYDRILLLSRTRLMDAFRRVAPPLLFPLRLTVPELRLPKCINQPPLILLTTITISHLRRQVRKPTISVTRPHRHRKPIAGLLTI